MEKGHLVLTRKISETIVINDDIEITFEMIKGNQAKVIIAAPKNIPVHRKEIYNRLKKEGNIFLKGTQNVNN